MPSVKANCRPGHNPHTLNHTLFGVPVSAATLAAMGQRKADEWRDLADHSGEGVKKATVKHLDETGLRLAGTLQGRQVASTCLLTFYRTAPKRGSLLAGVIGRGVPDCWRPYFRMEGVRPALCNAHPLRELKALIEIEKAPWALER